MGPGGISVNLGKEERGWTRAIFLDSALEPEKLDYNYTTVVTSPIFVLKCKGIIVAVSLCFGVKWFWIQVLALLVLLQVCHFSYS